MVDPFDAHAESYARIWDGDPIAQGYREVVHQMIRRHVTPGSRVLDVGCGIGTDAAWLVAQGHEVVGIDASAGMVAQARVRVPNARFENLRMEQLPGDLGDFELVLLDFGVINCVTLDVAIRGLRRVLRPGGFLVVVVMPRWHPMWVLAQGRRGRILRGLRRCRRQVPIDVEQGQVPTTFYSPRELRRSVGLSLVEQRSLGAITAPPGSKRQGWTGLEQRIAGWPGVRSVGDHVVMVFRR